MRGHLRGPCRPSSMQPLPDLPGQTRRELLAAGARLGAASLAVSLPGAMRVATATAARAGGSAEPALSGPPYKDTDYWAFADWCQPALEQLWDQGAGSYGGDGRVNAGMLVTHSIAALAGHNGPTRQDQRARMLVARMLQRPPYRPAGARGGRVGPGQRHTPGFVSGMSSLDSFQHVAVDPEMAEGLVFAWRARHVLSLPQDDVAAIEHEVAAIASGPFFRYPSVRLNQCNWPAEMYAYAAEVAGRSDLLRDDYRRQLSRFLRGCERPVAPWRIPNLSHSYSFHRDPLAPVGARENIESSEYANLVLGIVARYAQAKAAGMAPLPPEQLHTLRAWIAHAIPAYWTHSGYLNWDTGLFLERWHAGRYWAFAFDGLLAVASAPAELRSPELGAWAKYIFDRALGTYQRMAMLRGASQRIPASPVFGREHEWYLARWLFATRFQSQAARAIHAGLGHAPCERPPPLYAYDPGIGRLAITTPAYNTAVVAVSNGAFPYGGIELARLFDGEQRVAAGIGPYGAAGFGVTITDNRRTLLTSQTPRRSAGSRGPLALTHRPHPVAGRGALSPAHPYAGSFEELQCTAEITRGALSVRTTHTFVAKSIRTHWQIERQHGSDELEATVRFPTWARGASITAVLKRGGNVLLSVVGAQELALSSISEFVLRCDSGQSGYSLRGLRMPGRATARVMVAAPQSSNPFPGPQLVLSVARGRAWRDLEVQAEIVPGTTA